MVLSVAGLKMERRLNMEKSSTMWSLYAVGLYIQVVLRGGLTVCYIAGWRLPTWRQPCRTGVHTGRRPDHPPRCTPPRVIYWQVSVHCTTWGGGVGGRGSWVEVTKEDERNVGCVKYRNVCKRFAKFPISCTRLLRNVCKPYSTQPR